MAAILDHVMYTVSLLLYYLFFPNGAGGVEIVKLHVFQFVLVK